VKFGQSNQTRNDERRNKYGKGKREKKSRLEVLSSVQLKDELRKLEHLFGIAKCSVAHRRGQGCFFYHFVGALISVCFMASIFLCKNRKPPKSNI